jgi:RNA polymerase sigma-B factor
MSAPELALPYVADDEDPAADERYRARRMFAELADGLPDGRQRDRVREQLITMHLPLVRFLARRYANRGEPMDDLVQAGCIGLVKAVDRFDANRGLEFSTYAAPTILGEIRRHFRDRTWAVHVNRGLQELVTAVTRARSELTQNLGRAPTVAETASLLGRGEEEVLAALDCATAYTAESFETPVGEELTLGDTLGASDAGLDDVEMHEALRPMLDRLPAREQRILQLRFYGNHTQSQIAAQLGISQMHVSRLLARTLAQLRAELLADR